MILVNIGMGIPGIIERVASPEELNKAHPFFHQAAGQQTISVKMFTLGIIHANAGWR
jgi:hypothetical protein